MALDRALAACDASLKLRPDDAATLDIPAGWSIVVAATRKEPLSGGSRIDPKTWRPRRR